jgi:hypothetical protein
MMIDILCFLLGVKALPEDGNESWTLQWVAAPSGDHWIIALICAAAALWGVFFLYRREAAALGRRTRIGLSILRIVVIASLGLILLEPVLVIHSTEWKPSNLIVLADASASMGLHDSYENKAVAERYAETLSLENGAAELRGQSRWALAARILNGGLLEQLAAGGDRTVKVHSFTDRLDLADRKDSIDELKAGDGDTAIGGAIGEAIAAYRGSPVAGILLISDGQSTMGPSAVKSAEQAGGDGIPIAVLGVGTATGPLNIDVAEIEASPVAFVRDPMELRVIVETTGHPTAPGFIDLARRVDGGDWTEVGRREIELGADGRVQAVTFGDKHNTPAKIEYRATLTTDNTELTTDDNVATASVRVIRERIRALLIMGTAFPEVQFLRNALMRDRSVSMSSWLQTADRDYKHMGDRPIQRMPASQDELNEYDCAILYDPNPSLWPPNFSDMLVEFVGQAGGGLIYIAGEGTADRLFREPDSPTHSGLIDLLPVMRSPGLFRTNVEIRLNSRDAWQLRMTSSGVSDPILQFNAEPEEAERIQRGLPGMYWHLPVTRAKPGAMVLARHGDPRMRNEFGPHVLLATQLYGPGRTFFVGFDSTYRWRYLDEQYFDGFWARLIDRAGRNKQLGGRYPFRLTTDRDVYTPGGLCTVTATFMNDFDHNEGFEGLHAQYEVGDGPPTPIALLPDPDIQEPGTYSASFTVNETGKYFVKVWPGDRDDQTSARAATCQFEVIPANLEFERPTLDRLTLQNIANASHGRFFDIESAKEIPDAFSTGRVALVQPFHEELWDAPILWGTMLCMLFAEWIWRKRCQLV